MTVVTNLKLFIVIHRATESNNSFTVSGSFFISERQLAEIPQFVLIFARSREKRVVVARFDRTVKRLKEKD